jgi:PadR family transcriptional regulator AphA
MPTAPNLAEHVCLTLVTQGVSHGWAIGTLLTAEGELGRIWTLSRPLTYRAIDGLTEQRLIARRGARSNGGRDRNNLKPTAAGRRTARTWLDTPVEHVRDVRVELLLKLELRRRGGLSLEPLLAAQHDVLAPAIDALTTNQPGDLVDLWRRENARAVRRFLRDALEPPGARLPAAERTELRLSARNQLRATVERVVHGEVMSTVRAVLPDGQHLTAAVTKDAVDDLDIAADDEVLMIVKSTELMVAKPGR